ncbi:hypothetical protein CDCA_CDCA18G4569 [Cyanidium caldarium]|uniref:Mitochondrial carrier n=1 Tax=Cyanidium caldarium TaxID=2771 RepID=A0AAV9J230_CYACA|nr:hypothetical protein CDCA_CDCA18G4569 [Cyanidium caldarium]
MSGDDPTRRCLDARVGSANAPYRVSPPSQTIALDGRGMGTRPNLAQQMALGASSSAIATSFSAPFDLIKARLQLQQRPPPLAVKDLDAAPTNPAFHSATHASPRPRYRGMLHAGATIVREEGVLALWAGWNAAMWRAVTYSGTRLGLYQPVRDGYMALWNRWSSSSSAPDATTSPVAVAAALPVKLLAGATSGVLGALVGTPFEAAKVRMQSGTYTYRSTLQALLHMASERSPTAHRWLAPLQALWNGTAATAARAAAMTATQVGLYDGVKTAVADLSGWPSADVRVFFLAAMVAGVFSTTSTSAFDVVKTTQQNAALHTYRGMTDCAVQLWRAEGARVFLKGWVPAYVRLGPHTLITLWVYEGIRQWFGFTEL